jgi:asparagine synthase (glutamine-hydrolysing)
MCGIAGVINLNGMPVSRTAIRAMTDAIAHRGPDGEGHYIDGNVGLGHRRLAIIDLTPAGSQPMTTEDGSLVIVYNGEVYNFLELRPKLQARGCRFHSNTDTEVVLYAYREWGADCVHHFNGLFAFAVWDRQEGELFLARDRYGIKPLYYYWDGTHFIFGSEIKAILAYGAIQAQVCYEALSEYFTFQNIFTDLTLFEGVRLLPAGCTMTVGRYMGTRPRQRRYWDFSSLMPAEFTLSEDECEEVLYHLFVKAVTRQLISDVPVGSYLSGGMDSGSITAVASQHIDRLHTFTGGFDLSSASGLELGFDERPASEMMANLFKTEHYETVLHAGDMEYVLPKLIWHLEDLRIGQSYPNYYVARLASKFVKVVLSGGGGDELFAGYPWRYYRGLDDGDGGDYYRRYYDYWQRLVHDEDRSSFYNADTYRQVKDHDSFECFRGVFGDNPPALETDEDYIQASLYFEIKTFLHGLFVVEDKLSMAHSLETRVPFMDNDLTSFAMQIPPRFKLNNLRDRVWVDEDEVGKVKRYRALPTADGKIILRRAMSRLIPEDVTRRAKQGFSAPDASWFRGESITYVRQLLMDPRARLYQYLNPVYVRERLEEHMSGQVNRRLFIWSLLSFEWWLRDFLDGDGQF